MAKKIGLFDVDENRSRCSKEIVSKVQKNKTIFWAFLIILLISVGCIVPILFYGAESVVKYIHYDAITATPKYMPTEEIPVNYDMGSGNTTYLTPNNISYIVIANVKLMILSENMLNRIEDEEYRMTLSGENTTFNIALLYSVAVRSATQGVSTLIPYDAINSSVLVNNTEQSLMVFDDLGYMDIQTNIIIRIPRTFGTQSSYIFPIFDVIIGDTDGNVYYLPCFVTTELSVIKSQYKIGYGTFEMRVDDISYNATAMMKYLINSDIGVYADGIGMKAVVEITKNPIANLFLSPSQF